MDERLTLFAKFHDLHYRVIGDNVGVLLFPSVEHTFIDNGVEMVRGVTPVLLTADEGETWTPDVMIEGHPQWSRRSLLKGEELLQECLTMYKELRLEGVDKILQVVADLRNI